MKKITLISLFITASFAIYNVGQTVSNSDQNVILEVCDNAFDNEGNILFGIGDEVKLSDWNGSLNGGTYYVTWLDMSASW